MSVIELHRLGELNMAKRTLAGGGGLANEFRPEDSGTGHEIRTRTVVMDLVVVRGGRIDVCVAIIRELIRMACYLVERLRGNLTERLGRS
jgi:hypothetical protein